MDKDLVAPTYESIAETLKDLELLRSSDTLGRDPDYGYQVRVVLDSTPDRIFRVCPLIAPGYARRRGCDMGETQLSLADVALLAAYAGDVPEALVDLPYLTSGAFWHVLEFRPSEGTLEIRPQRPAQV